MNLKIESFSDGVAVVTAGNEYLPKELHVPEEFITDSIINESAFLNYVRGFVFDRKPTPITRSVFVGPSPKPELLQSLQRLQWVDVIINPNIWADYILYDYDQNESFVRYVEKHDKLYDMTRLCMHNKWITNELARIINMDFTATMPRSEMLTPFPKIVFPKKMGDFNSFFDVMPLIVVKPLYGMQDNQRVFDRKVYDDRLSFEQDIIQHYGSLESFYGAQNASDFVWTEDNAANTPIMIQEYFDQGTASYTVRCVVTGLGVEFVDSAPSSVTTAINYFLKRTGTIKELATFKCVCDNNGYAYIVDVSFAINGFLSLPPNELDDILNNVLQ